MDTTNSWSGVNIGRNTKKSLYFLNNSITAQGEGYMLQAGDEMPGPTNNNLDGSIITGNKFIWNGNDSIINEAMFMGYNINNEVKYNFLKGAAYGICSKSSGMTCTSGGIAYNIVIDAMSGALAKGISGVRFYNNTFYSSRNMAESGGNGQIHIYANDDADKPWPVQLIAKFLTTYFTPSTRFIISLLTKHVCQDLNVIIIYIIVNQEPLYFGSQAKPIGITFKQWQAMGYDTHSVVVNPNFSSNTFIPSIPLYLGKDLGEEWKQGLSPSAEWGTTSPALQTRILPFGNAGLILFLCTSG